MILDPKDELPALDWRTRAMVRATAKKFYKKTGWGIQIRSGLRSCVRQNELYAQGRTTPGNIVTNAPGCRSWHVSGRAIDFRPFHPKTGEIIANGYHPLYKIMGNIWKEEGGTWGGDFSGLFDPGHLEWHPDVSIDEICPTGTPCSRFQVDNRMPIWAYFAAGTLLIGTGVFGYVALRPAQSAR